MSYRTILVHLESLSQAENLLKAAVQLAGQHQSHLIGTFVTHPLELYIARVSDAHTSGEIANALMKEQIERGKKLEVLFEKATEGQNLVAEWRFDKNLLSPMSAGVLEQARSADVLMVSTELEANQRGFSHENIAPVITNSSRPTIVVPEDIQDKPFGKFVFVAWDSSRESSRAVFDALPILKGADTVWLHRVNSTNESKRHTDESTRNLADALARHDVKIEISETSSSSRKVGQEILTCARDRGADCIVMGAYGHSRMHGFLLGDVTRHLLGNTPVPLIMSH